MTENAIEIVGLDKRYPGQDGSPGQHALKAVDLSIPKGAFFGLLGPNGAGKSTLINILAGLVVKTAGSAKVWGFDIETEMRAARRSIGIVPQELNMDPFFTAREMLEMQAGLFGVPVKERRTEEILRTVGLMDKADTYSRRLSGGMRRRLMVAKAMVHSPPILVLDEPTAGVDVELRHQLWTHIRELNRQGTTVLLTTHYLEEAEQLCDHIAIINHGRVIASQPTRDMLSRLDSKELTVVIGEDIAALPETLSPFNVELASERRLVFRYKPSEIQIRDILRAVANAGLTINDLSTQESDLEDIFITLTRADNAEAEG